MKYKLSKLVELFGGELLGEDIEVEDILPTDVANEEQLTFISNDKYKKNIKECKAGAIIIGANMELQEITVPVIKAANPYYYFCKVSQLFHAKKPQEQKIASTAQLSNTALVLEGASIADFVVIGNNVKIGKNCQIFAHVTILDDVTIGENVIIYPNVTIYSKVTIGDDCIFHSGVVVGADGFGYAPDQNKMWHKIPQNAGVQIGNNVELGANTTVDGGTFSPTIIEDGVKIDNLVQIAHNVVIGAHSAIASQVGIAGSTKIGKYCQIGGGSGIIGHIQIADYTVIGAATGVSKNITKPDLYFSVYPFSTYKEWAKNAVHIRHLNDMFQKMKVLELELLQLKQHIGVENDNK